MAKNNLVGLLAEIRAIAQNGLNYVKDPYDEERYRRLLDLAAMEYAQLTGLPEAQLMDEFKKELGFVTPKIGVGGAVFSEDGKILLIRRHDDKRWSLPAGAAEVHETPEEGAIREIREETGLHVQVDALIGVFSRLAGTFGQASSIYSIYYHCLPVGGELSTSRESLEVGFFDHRGVGDWHKDSGERAEVCYQFWRQKFKS